MSTPAPYGARDAIALAALLGSAALLGAPIWAGGWATYLDNPAHLAELASLARGESWCTEAFCGFPVGLLHAPLAYGLLARLVALGAPIGAVYGGALALGLVAQPLALYAVARRRVGPEAAFVPAWLLLAQPTALEDFGSALGGMWTFHLAGGALLLLLERVARPGPRSVGDVAVMAALLGFIANLHAMVAVAAVLLAIAWLALRPAAHRAGPSTLAADAGAAALGVALGAPYWLPMALGREGMLLRQQSLGPDGVLLRLLVRVDLNDLWRKGATVSESVDASYGLPALVLVGLGAWGAWEGRHDRVVALASRWALLILGILLVVAPTQVVPGLGPLTWRFVWAVHLGLAVAATAVPWPSLAPRLALARLAALAVALVASTLIWRQPLALAVPVADDPELIDVERLWAWLGDNPTPRGGRVYLQSTLGTPPQNALWRSQVLARTADEAGVETLGTWYGITPFQTGTWTPGEFGRIFRTALTETGGADTVITRLRRTNCARLVASDPDVRRSLGRLRELSEVKRIGRFTVYDLESSGWVKAVAAQGDVTSVRREPGRYEFDVRTPAESEFLVREAWHPFWRVIAGEATLTPASDGLMTLRTSHTGKIVLAYSPPAWPGWIGAGAGVALVGLALASVRTRRSR